MDNQPQPTNTTAPQHPQPPQPTPEAKKSNRGAIALIAGSLVGVLVLAIVAVQSTQLAYNSKASMRPTPVITRMPDNPTPMATVTPGPINSKAGLLKALDEVDSQSTKAAEVIQSQITELDATGN